MSRFAESAVEEAALEWLGELGYTILHGPEIAFGEPKAERNDFNFRDVLLSERLRASLSKLNKDLPVPAIEEVLRRITLLDGPSTITRNQTFHRMLVDGVTVE